MHTVTVLPPSHWYRVAASYRMGSYAHSQFPRYSLFSFAWGRAPRSRPLTSENGWRSRANYAHGIYSLPQRTVSRLRRGYP